MAVKPNPNPHDSDIVIARIGQEITLKGFHRRDDERIELQPQSTNAAHRPIVLYVHIED